MGVGECREGPGEVEAGAGQPACVCSYNPPEVMMSEARLWPQGRVLDLR